MVQGIITKFIIKDSLRNVVDVEGIRIFCAMLIHAIVIYEDALIRSSFRLRCCRRLLNDVGGRVNVINVCGPFLIAIRRSSCLSLLN